MYRKVVAHIQNGMSQINEVYKALKTNFAQNDIIMCLLEFQ